MIWLCFRQSTFLCPLPYLCTKIVHLATCYITRKEHFNAAHRLSVAEWSDEQNEAVFGKCANKNWHGHNFTLEVTIKGNPDPVTGFIINLKDLGRIIKTNVTEKVDHKNLNLDVDFMQGIQPTIENLAIAVWQQLIPHIPAGELYSVRISETDRNSIEYRGE
jgi:6-pyruvoyltetrahydropterin/6-carboxytetrahydropterin synthase